jgi:hypothetical protein
LPMFSTRAFNQPWVASCVGAIAFALLCGAFVFPLLRVGFVGEDIYRSAIPAYASLSHLSIFAALREVAQASDQTARAPLQAFILTLWFARPPEIVVRILQCALLIANVATFALLSGRLFGTRAAGLVATVFAFVTLQIRFGNDAILGSTATSTIGCEFVLLALLAWLRFAEKATLARFGVALAAYAIALAGDAAAVSLIAIVPIFFVLRNDWAPMKRIWAAVAFIGVGAIVLTADYAFAPGKIVLPSIAAIFGQLVAAVPLVYRAFHWLVPGGASSGGTPPDQRFLGVPGAGVAGLLLAFGGMTAAYVAMRYYLAPSPRPAIIRASAIGAALWIAPAFLAGHATAAITQPLPTVYVQSFGMALLLTAGFTVLARWRASGLATIALLFVGLTLLGNSAEASLVAQRVSRTDAVRTAIERAGAAGIFESLPGGSMVALDAKSYPFRFTRDWRDASYLLYMYAQAKYEAVSAATLRLPMGKNDTWIMRYTENAKEGLQQLAFGRYSRVVAPNLQIDQSIAYQRYATGDLRAEGLGVLDAGGRGMSAGTSLVGEDAAIVVVRRTCGPVEQPLALLPTTPTIQFGSGFLPDFSYIPADIILSAEVPFYDVTTPHTWRFMGRSAELTVSRDSCRQTPLVLTMTLASAEPTIVSISTPGRIGLYPVSQYPESVRFEIPDNRQRPARVHIETNAPAARLYDFAPRGQGREFRPDARLFVMSPKAQYL